VAQLIDSCGLKGYTVGGAQVSPKHANFIVNLGTATAQDVWSIITHVKATVKEKTGVDIQTEVIRMGRWG
jgi:UDP-N-acetylmuramate dehydrogenase